MRLILRGLARANLRWGTAALMRSERLARESFLAACDVERHYTQAQALADRLGLPGPAVRTVKGYAPNAYPKGSP